MKKNKITILGSGTSTGVPMPGCTCDVCQSPNPKNKRMRSSVFIKSKSGNSILVDASPDLRTQLLANDIAHVDGAILTHAHADHIHGIDDLRPLCFVHPNKKIPIFTNQVTATELEQRFRYIFRPKEHFKDRPILGGGIPRLSLKIIQPGQVQLLNESFEFLKLPHGNGISLSFVHSKLAYIIDCHEIPDKMLNLLKSLSLEIIIIDCVNPTKHQTHLTFPKVIEYLKFLRPQRAYLIHMGHQLEHEKLVEDCRTSFEFPVMPTFDGMELEYS